MGKKLGALPDFKIKDLMSSGHIKGASEANVMPASLNLSLSEEIYRIEDVFQPREGRTVRDVLGSIGALQISPEVPLERGVNYLARLNETLRLPGEIYGYCNPRSSTGRNDVLIRVVGDNSPCYDGAAPAGYTGELWAIITPKSYGVRLAPGKTLTQLRLFNANTRFDELELEIAMERDQLLWRTNGEPITYRELKTNSRDGSVILTVDLSPEIVGWECLGTSKILDFSQRAHYNPYDFFRPIKVDGDRIRLKEGGFYILYTEQCVRVPPHLSCEMVSMDARLGEFRSHYAGFIDPGWGYGNKERSCGRRLVLEIRPFENIIFEEGQPAARIRFEAMYDIPEKHYDQLDDSSYTTHTGAPKLSSHFKME